MGLFLLQPLEHRERAKGDGPCLEGSGPAHTFSGRSIAAPCHPVLSLLRLRSRLVSAWRRGDPWVKRAAGLRWAALLFLPPHRCPTWL